MQAGAMAKMRVRQLFWFLIATQTIQAAGVASGSEMVRKVGKAAANAKEALKPTQNAIDSVRTVTVDADGLADEVLKPTQDVKTSGSGMVRKLAINAAGLPDDFNVTQEGKFGGSVLVRKVVANDADGLPDELKAAQESKIGWNALVRKVAANAAVSVHDYATQAAAESSQTIDYAHAKATLTHLADLGDMMLLESGERTSREAELPDRITGEKLAGLVASVAAGGATPEMVEVITKILSNLETGALKKIKEGHADAQNQINAIVTDLSTMTVDAVAQRRVAVGYDTAWLACMAEETTLLQQKETCSIKVVALTKEMETSCAFTDFNATSPLPGGMPGSEAFSCNLRGDDCLTGTAGVKQNIENWLVTLNAAIAKATTACNAATNEYDKQVVECNGKQTALSDKAIECERKKGQRSIAMCVFGDKLHAKCRQKQVYDTTMAQIDGSGNVLSEPDRRSEWNSLSTVTCMLKKLQAGGTLTNAEMSSCENSSEYTTAVGTLDKKSQEYGHLIAPDNFTCEEQNITFNSSQSVNASTGSKAFDFCKEGDTGKNCSTFAACPGTLSKRDDATICQLATGCTVADCCILPWTSTPQPPTPSPTASPTPLPTEAPTQSPTESPTPSPTESPTASPTEAPTVAPTESPTELPTAAPTEATPAPTDATPAPTDATPAPTDATPAPTMCGNAQTSPTDSVVKMVVGSSADVWPVDKSWGGHFGTCTDPLAAFNGGMILWKSPGVYTYEVIFPSPMPVANWRLNLFYDAPAWVRIYALPEDGGEEIGKGNCWYTKDNKVMSCGTQDLRRNLAPKTMSGFRIKVDSKHSDWFLMGNISIRKNDGIYLKTFSQTLAPTPAPTMKQVNAPVGIFRLGPARDAALPANRRRGQGIGAHCGSGADKATEAECNEACSTHPTCGAMELRGRHNGEDVRFTRGNTCILWIVGVNTGTVPACPAGFNGSPGNAKVIKYYATEEGKSNPMSLNSWVRIYEPKTELTQPAKCSATVSKVKMVAGSSANVWPLSKSWGGHIGTSSDPLAAWAGGMILWKSPIVFTYEVIFPSPMPVSNWALTLNYDAPAWVRIYALPKDGGEEIGKGNCWYTKDNKVMSCGRQDLRRNLAPKPMSGFRITVDSKHNDWSFMGNFTIYDNWKTKLETCSQ